MITLHRVYSQMKSLRYTKIEAKEMIKYLVSRVGVVVARLTCMNQNTMRRSLVQSGYVAYRLWILFLMLILKFYLHLLCIGHQRS